MPDSGKWEKTNGLLYQHLTVIKKKTGFAELHEHI